MTDRVVDASVAFKWLVPDRAEADVPAAKALLADHVEGRACITVPSLLFFEVGNILLHGRSRPPRDEAAAALADLLALRLEIAPFTALDADATLRLAARHGITFCDAAYVALAESLDGVLVTADVRLLRTLGASPHVRALGSA